MEDVNSDFLPRRHSRVGMLVLEFDRVSEDILSRSDSFNNNGFVSGKLLWGSKKALDQRWSHVELGRRGDLSSAPLAVASVVSKEEDRHWFFA
jgi:hypothetical protein